MKLTIVNMQPLRLEDVGRKREKEATIEVVSFQANARLVTIVVDREAESFAALRAIGLHPQVVQGGRQFILQTEQIHIKGIAR